MDGFIKVGVGHTFIMLQTGTLDSTQVVVHGGIMRVIPGSLLGHGIGLGQEFHGIGTHCIKSINQVMEEPSNGPILYVDN